MADLNFRVVVKDDGSAVITKFGDNLKKVSKSAKKSGKDIGDSFSGATKKVGGLSSGLGVLKGAFTAIGIGLVVRQLATFTGSVLNAANTVEAAKVRLRAIRGSAEEAAKAFKVFEDVAASVPFTLENVIQAGTQLEAFGASVEDTLAPVADLAAFMGVDIVEAAQGFGRAFAAGAGAADVLRERGVLATVSLRSGIDDLTKLSLPEFRRVLLEALSDPLGPIAGQTKELAKTWQGQLSIMEDAVFKLKTTIADSGLLEFAKDVIQEITFTVKASTFALKQFTGAVDDNGNVVEKTAKQIALLIDLDKQLERATLGAFKPLTELPSEAFDEVGRLRNQVQSLVEEFPTTVQSEAILEPFKELPFIIASSTEQVNRLQQMVFELTLGLSDLDDPDFQFGGGEDAEIQSLEEDFEIRRELERDFQEQRRGIVQDAIEADILALEEKSILVDEKSREDFERELELASERGASLVAIRKKFSDQETKLDSVKRKTLISGTAALFGALSQLAEAGGDKLFGVAKAFAIAEAVIAGSLAVQRALASPPGPPSTIPLAIAVGIQTAANVATIASAKPGGAGGALGGVGGIGVGAGGATPTGGEPIALRGLEVDGEEIERPIQVNISVTGFIGDESELASQIGEIFREATRDNVDFGLQSSGVR